MTKKKIEVLTWLREGFEEECGLAPYSAESISHVVNDCNTTNSLTRAMRKTLNTMVEEGLLYKVNKLAEVTIKYKGAAYGVTINKNMWHYDLIENYSSAKEVIAKRLSIEDDKEADIDSQELSDIDIDNDLVNELSECDEPVNDIDDEESIWIDIMIDHANDTTTEEEDALLAIMAEDAGH